MRAMPIDPRAWFLWAIALALPPLVGRNPFPVVTCAVVAGAVALAYRGSGSGWGTVVRLAGWFAAVGVVFNVLTVHAGDWVITTLPDWLPLIGGPLTWNAALFGLVSGIALITVVLIGVTLTRVLDWVAVMRMLPDRFAGLAAVGAIAWTLVPQTGRALTEIREAQVARGYQPRGMRDAGPLVVPLLAGGLERATVLGEALEARAFGSSAGVDATRRREGFLLLLAVTAGVVAAYAVMLRAVVLAAVLLAIASMLTWLALRTPSDGIGRTRYRQIAWDRRATVIAGASSAALVGELFVLMASPSAFAWEPYPSMVIPVANLLVLGCIALLLAPLAVQP